MKNSISILNTAIIKTNSEPTAVKIETESESESGPESESGSEQKTESEKTNLIKISVIVLINERSIKYSAAKIITREKAKTMAAAETRKSDRQRKKSKKYKS